MIGGYGELYVVGSFNRDNEKLDMNILNNIQNEIGNKKVVSFFDAK